ncbi:MAG: hypothetical protein ABR905_04275 [Terracidiphilus sp.]
MQVFRLLVLMGLVLAISCASIEAGAVAVTPFAIKATNVIMPSVTAVKTSDGVTWIPIAPSQITVTGIPGDGTLTISCRYSGSTTKARIPEQCGRAGWPGIPVSAGETFTGTVSFVPYDQGPVPGVSQLRRDPAVTGCLPATALALAGVLMLGFRHKTLRWLAVTVLAVGALAAALEASASGRKAEPMTPGTYEYTISANFRETPDTRPGQSVSTKIRLTVN